MNNKNIIYTGEFRFPNGDAGAQRVLGIGKALALAGWRSSFAGAEKHGRKEDFNKGGGLSFDGFSYFPQDETRTKSLNPIARLGRYFQAGRKTSAWLERQPIGSINAIILYNGLSSHHIFLRQFCQRHALPFVIDRTEWYDPASCVGGRFGLVRWDVEATMRFWAPKADAAIVISIFLERHFRKYGCDCLRVPPLVDLLDVKWPAIEQQTFKPPGLRLVFAGHAGKKDYIINAVRGLGLLGNFGKNVRLILIGPTRRELADGLGEDAGLLDCLGEQLEFVGTLPHEQALVQVAKCDFSVILRPNARYANAGFPTKLVESFVCGVPVLCNLTSDMGLYVRDGVEGFVVGDHSPEAFRNGVLRALSLTPKQHELMKFNARRQAEISFDHRKWESQISNFMERAAIKKLAAKKII